jgi:hypothetical protein
MVNGPSGLRHSTFVPLRLLCAFATMRSGENIVLKITATLEKPRRGQTFYCNCQKSGCFPCQNTGVIIADTEDGSLQLCKGCRKHYAEQKEGI